ncbi:MAG: flavodoxin domain-containing protein [Anaerolineales bacterium]
MKATVVYDSQFGNTKKIAHAIGGGLGSSENVKVIKIGNLKVEDYEGIDLLVVGCPTQRLTATPPISDWIKSLPDKSLKGIRAAAFDTRLTEEKINEIRVLAFFVKIFGYAAKPIAKGLMKKGADLAVNPEGFYVADTEGPLLEKELERAAEWGVNIGTSSLS